MLGMVPCMTATASRRQLVRSIGLVTFGLTIDQPSTHTDRLRSIFLSSVSQEPRADCCERYSMYRIDAIQYVSVIRFALGGG